MDFGSVTASPKGVIVDKLKRFKLEEILDNGQCFRWVRIAENHYSGIAYGRGVTLTQAGDQLTIEGATLADFENIWQEYFDLSRSYEEITTHFMKDETLKKAMSFAPGLRVLKQEPWEALASFILSQNNNIKRIKGLVERFCESFGEEIDGGYAFPRVESIASLSADDLAPVRAGFRSKYIIDSARKVVDGTVSLQSPFFLPIDEAREHLMQINGVGPKVSNCVLLFGFNRIDAMPVDVWVKRALDHFYPKGFPKELNPWAGIAQQYLFHYTRISPDALPEEA